MSIDISLDIDNQVYLKRLVKSEQQFCIICMHPTKICLYKKNFIKFKQRTYADWFYLCEDHLFNADLLIPQKSKEVNELEKEIENLNKQLKTKNQEVIDGKTTWIDSAMTQTTSYISSKLPFTRSKKEDEELEKESNENIKEDFKLEKKTKKQELVEILDDLTGRKDQLSLLTSQTKYFCLTNPTYYTRKENLIKSLDSKFEPRVVDKGVSSKVVELAFPSAPTHNPM
ncbi:hypothetical protein QEN19_003134 [Hanseniaspora menglaensis]